MARESAKERKRETAGMVVVEVIPFLSGYFLNERGIPLRLLRGILDPSG
jgi:hypothetical protein